MQKVQFLGQQGPLDSHVMPCAHRCPWAYALLHSAHGSNGLSLCTDGLLNWRVWYLGFIWFLMECAIFGIIFWYARSVMLPRAVVSCNLVT